MPPDALQGAMDETLTPETAARMLAKASAYEGPLQQRTEGITAMVWGVVVGGMYMHYGLAVGFGFPGWTFSLLWIPWIAAGSLLTFALWRSAALSSAEIPRATAPAILARIVGVSLLFTIVFWIARPDGPLLPLAIVGALWMLMAAVNVWRASRLGRALWLASGAACVLAAGILALLRAPIEIAGSAAILLPSALPFLAGLWQTLRG